MFPWRWRPRCLAGLVLLRVDSTDGSDGHKPRGKIAMGQFVSWPRHMSLAKLPS